MKNKTKKKKKKNWVVAIIAGIVFFVVLNCSKVYIIK